MLKAVSWRSNSVFTSFSVKDISFLFEGVRFFGPFVAAGERLDYLLLCFVVIVYISVLFYCINTVLLNTVYLCCLMFSSENDSAPLVQNRCACSSQASSSLNPFGKRFVISHPLGYVAVIWYPDYRPLGPRSY